MTTTGAESAANVPSGTPVTAASPVTQAVWTAGAGSTGAQGSGNQLNLFLHAPPPQRTPAGEGEPTPSAAEPTAGALPVVWNVSPRNPGFAGRERELADLLEQLSSGGSAVVQALHGMGGIGKTQLATEYAYRHAANYDVVWWISAEQTGLVGEQYAALGAALGLVASDADSVTASREVKRHLRSRDRWLLIFDNAESPDDLIQWLPGGPGHVIITSRQQRWNQLAVVVEIDVLTRAESILLLTSHHPMLGSGEADELAEALGDLPLALVQAASFLAETGMSIQEYRQALTSEVREVLGEGRPVSYPRSLAATIAVSTARLAEIDPASLAILRLCAFLAPEPVPVELLAAIVQFKAATQDEAWGLAPLAAVIAKPLARGRSIGRIRDYGLAKVSVEGITVHRLVQAVVRDQLAPTAVEQLRSRIDRVLAMAEPGDPRDPAAWPGWARLLPHLLAADPASSSNPDLRDLACQAIVFLIVRGDARPAQQLADHLYQQWRLRLGSDDPHALRAATELVWANRDLGQLHQLRPLIEETLARRRRLLGQDDPDTLRSTSDLAVVLNGQGHFEQARQMHQDVLERRRRVLGEDHPDTLMSAANLAGALFDLGRYEQTRRLEEDVLERRRRVLGEDHPDTLRAIGGLANTLYHLGLHQQALRMEEDVLERRRRVLGEDHPDTLSAVSSLAGSLRRSGRFEQALRMEEDVVERRRRVLGEDHLDTLNSLSGMAATLVRLGRFEQARRLNEDVLERRRRVLGEDHPDTLSAVSGLAAVLYDLGDMKQALRMEEDVLERRRRLLGEDHPDTLGALSNLALTLHKLGQSEQARQMEQDVLERRRSVLGEDHPETLTALSNLADILSELGEVEHAQRMEEDVLERRRRSLGENHPETLAAISSRASTLYNLGKYEQARQLHHDVLEQRRRLLGEDHHETLLSAVNLAMCLSVLGRKMPARRLVDQGFQGLRAILGTKHQLTQWAREARSEITASMGGRQQIRSGRRR